MVDKISSGSLYSYTDLVSKTKETQDTNIFDKESSSTTLIPDQYQITNAIKSQIAGYENQMNEFQDKINTLTSEKNAYSTIEESLNNINTLQQDYASGDYTAEEKTDMQSQIDQEMENINNTLEQAKDDGLTIEVDNNLQNVLDSEMKIDGQDQEMLGYAVDNIFYNQESVQTRMETAETGLERVQEKYDDAINAQNTVQNMSDAQNMLDEIANQMTGAGSMEFYSISRDTVNTLLNM
ncbi:MAG: hypothetical protein C0601_05250 [Candidatus Muiribacterium halophilum]|uniref:Flagellin n=1 Tax=Muiribacterium halophilum TaxID=2053465 RepID=A0A2N5ZHX3_MUIH1|nr:MAG: hypothetical protein C0601_05250 [Candidatus Muirbacterium halophilum]